LNPYFHEDDITRVARAALPDHMSDLVRSNGSDFGGDGTRARAQGSERGTRTSVTGTFAEPNRPTRGRIGNLHGAESPRSGAALGPHHSGHDRRGRHRPAADSVAIHSSYSKTTLVLSSRSCTSTREKGFSAWARAETPELVVGACPPRSVPPVLSDVFRWGMTTS